jgi:hypothetical protein
MLSLLNVLSLPRRRHHLLFFMHLMIYFELNDPEIGLMLVGVTLVPGRATNRN